MDKVVIFVLLVLTLYGASAIFIDDNSPNRITNGNEAPINQFPYSVSLQRLQQVQTASRGHKCGGALITFQHVLTAAKCLYEVVNGSTFIINPSDYRIFAGGTLLTDDFDQNRFRFIANFTIHPEYVAPPASVNDIAIITLQTPFVNTTVSPIALPVANFIPVDFSLCQVASWGARFANETASNILRFTTKYVYNQNLCASLYSQLPTHPNIFPSMICAASFDIISSGCNGDEGIPLVCNGGLTGLMIQTNGCAVSSFPEVYTRVSNYTAWIRSISGSSITQPQLTYFGVLAIVVAKFISKL